MQCYGARLDCREHEVAPGVWMSTCWLEWEERPQVVRWWEDFMKKVEESIRERKSGGSKNG